MGDSRVVQVPGRVNLALAGQGPKRLLAAALDPGLQHHVEGEDRPHADGDHGERDQRAARVAPEVAPGDRGEEREPVHLKRPAWRWLATSGARAGTAPARRWRWPTPARRGRRAR